MHPYLAEQHIKARNEDLHRELSRVGSAHARRRTWPRPSLRHGLGWLLVSLGLRLALGRAGARRALAARPGGGPAITHG
jgi:hypothetical protein